MVAPIDIEKAIKRVRDRSSFVRGLLADTLEWPIPDSIEELQDLGYGWTPDDLTTRLITGGVLAAVAILAFAVIRSTRTVEADDWLPISPYELKLTSLPEAPGASGSRTSAVDSTRPSSTILRCCSVS